MDVPMSMESTKMVSMCATSKENGIKPIPNGSASTFKVISESKIKVPSSYKASKAPDFSKAHKQHFNQSKCLTDIVVRVQLFNTSFY